MSVRAVSAHGVYCDGLPDGASAPICARGYDQMATQTPTEIRKRRRREGWHRTKDGRDLCPSCWELEPQ